jgi:ubiquinone/menaquinone biosynthesis C-methylase UbiE
MKDFIFDTIIFIKTIKRFFTFKYFEKRINIGLSNLLTREKWLEKTLNRIPSGFTILDAGAGELKYKKYCEHLNYIGQDFAKYDGKGNNIGLQTKQWDTTKVDIVSDITAIPFKNKSIDAIMSIEVFEHIPDPIEALSEFTRILKPNGYLILTAPFASLTHFAPYHYYSGYNSYFYDWWLKKLGYEILDIQRNGNFFEYIAQELRRVDFCAKQYTRQRFRFLDKLSRYLMLKSLQRLGRDDRGSGQLLCFGYHIFAQKRDIGNS